MGETSNKSVRESKRVGSKAAHAVKSAGFVAAAQDAPGSRDTFVGFLAQQLEPYIGQRVLHLNAGAGGLCRALLPRGTYVACAQDPSELTVLQAQMRAHPQVEVGQVKPPFAEHLPRHKDGYDTILWARETPFSQLDRLALRHLRTALAPHGRILLLVTGAKAPFEAMEAVAEGAQLQLRQFRQFDRLGTPVAQAQRLMSWVGLGTPVQALGDALRPLASRWDDRWPFAGRHALAVLVHPPVLAEAECTSEDCQTVRLRPKQPLS